jgi:hypothetical protein
MVLTVGLLVQRLNREENKMAYGSLGNTGGQRPVGRWGAFGRGGKAPGVGAGAAAKGKPRPAKKLTGTSKTGVSKVTGGLLKNGKPAKYGPKNKKLTPAQRGAQTRAMNKWKAQNAKGAASEGPKKITPKSTATKTSKVTGKKVAGGTAAAAGITAAGYGAYKAEEKDKRKRVTGRGGSSSSRGEWTGTGYRKK